MRPNSRTVSVSQGKGLDLTQALASALMEAIEGFHAEEVGEGRRASYREIAVDNAVVDPLALCTTGRPFDVDAKISWLEGYDLLEQEPCLVPAEIVHTDYTQPLDGYFLGRLERARLREPPGRGDRLGNLRAGRARCRRGVERSWCSREGPAGSRYRLYR